LIPSTDSVKEEKLILFLLLGLPVCLNLLLVHPSLFSYSQTDPSLFFSILLLSCHPDPLMQNSRREGKRSTSNILNCPTTDESFILFLIEEEEKVKSCLDQRKKHHQSSLSRKEETAFRERKMRERKRMK